MASIYKEKKISKLVMDFIMSRHRGDVSEAKKIQAILKRKLGRSFTKTMLQYGNPDIDGYETVLRRWEVSI